MLTNECRKARERMPIFLSKETAGDTELKGHLAECLNCRAEWEFVNRLYNARPEPPRHLADQIVARIFQPQRATRMRWARSGWAAAAALLLGFGIGSLVVDRMGPASMQPVALMLEPTPIWYGEEWLVAGEPLLEELPDDVLQSLLAELDQ